MHPDRDGLLADVIAHPDDDLPRLIFADWCEEHGDPERAEFIRVQIALAPLHESEPAAAPLLGREGELLAANRERWRAELPELPDGLEWGAFRRGFVEALTVHEGGPLPARAAEARAAAPLRRLTLCSSSAGLWVQRSPALIGLPELEERLPWLSSALAPPSCLPELLAWPGAARLRHLGLSRVRLALPDLASAPLPALTSLDLDQVVMAGPGGPLEPPPWLGQLERLALVGLPLGDFVLGALLDVIPPGRLRRLVLRRCQLTEVGAAQLARHPLAAGLRLLDLRENHLDPEAMRALLARALPAGAILDVGA
jgi:uncharacterized protein (TIGR02996 family)